MNKNKKIQIFGHRGYSSQYPENTILSFKEAIAAGCDGVELDLQLTKDNEIVVIHDQKLERTTNRKGYVKDYNLAELKKADTGSEQKIPTLEEVLNEIKKVKLFLEIKNYGYKTDILCSKIIALIKRHRAAKRCFFISFDYGIIKKIRKLMPQAKTGLIFSVHWPPIIDELEFIPKTVNALCPRKDRINPIVVEYAKQNKLLLFAWTVDSQKDIRQVTRYNINGLMSNDPGFIINQLAERK